MGEGAAEREAAPVSMADTAARRRAEEGEGRGVGPRPGAAGLGPAGARSFFLNKFRGKNYVEK